MATALIEAVRSFNRAYTQRIGVLQEKHLGSAYSLTQVRLLYELAHRQEPTASELSRDLGLDPGYVSRTLAGFHKLGLLQRRPSPADARQQLLTLTKKGWKAFEPLDAKARERVDQLIQSVPETDRPQFASAITTLQRLFVGGETRKRTYSLRDHRPGDMGWVVQRHGEIYAREYGWDERFEALVARITADFIDNLEPKRERCWIAESEGRNVGCIFVVSKSATVAKLRLLLVEPEARGLGIGGRLIDECIAFARRAGYQKMILWTQSNLLAARRLYAGAGFKVTQEEAHDSFGHKLTSETWELKL